MTFEGRGGSIDESPLLFHEISRHGWSVAVTSSAAGSLAHTVPGDTHAFRARERVREAVGLENGFQFMSQVHGNTIAHIDTLGLTPEADAMVTQSVPLAVLVADCLPVVFTGQLNSGLAPEQDDTFAAVIHAGRAGINNEVLPKTVAEVRALGARELDVWIGPGICGECYEVPAELREEMSARWPSAWATTRAGTPALNLAAAAAEQIRTVCELSGLPLRLSIISRCTAEDHALFSHRRAPGQGRFAALVYPTTARSSMVAFELESQS